MSVIVPPAKNYVDPIIAVPSNFNRVDPLGQRQVNLDVVWGTMGGPNNCISFNMQSKGAAVISQICAISIDNSACGADLLFIFPDTDQTYPVPAGSPADVFPVFTNQTQFYLSCPGAIPSDVTRFAVLNYPTAPSSIPATQEQNNAGVGEIPEGIGTTIVIPAGTNGTIEAISVFANLPADSNGADQFYIVDGVGKQIATLQVGTSNNTQQNVQVLSLSNLAMRFQNGLNFVVTQDDSNATYSVNLYYKKP